MNRTAATDSFILKFGIACVIPTALIAIGLTQFLSHQVRARTFASQRAAAMLAASSVQTSLAPYDLEQGLTPAAFLGIDKLLLGLRSGGIDHVTIWSNDGRVLYSDRRADVGRRLTTLRLLDVDSSRVTSQLLGSDGTKGGSESFAVFVPLRFHGDVSPRGTLQLTTPFGPIRDGINRTTDIMNLILLAGLTLLYAALFPIAYGMSRRLRRQAEENHHLALHDHLTGLPNRALFLDRVEQALRQARRDGGGATVLLMDVDRFKEINDSLGHHSGDRILQQLADRLRSVLRETDTLARLGGDEFAMVLPQIDALSFHFALERIKAALETPCLVSGLPLQIETSIGVASYPEHASSVDALIRNADIAMYVAKRSNSDYAVYDPNQDEYNSDRIALIAELRRAIANGELVLHYQPKLDLGDRNVTSVEALVRWQHPRRGLLGPAEFIPLAQHTSLIDPLTHYVLGAALAQAREWHDQGLEISVAVNIATRNLIDPGFPAAVRALLAQHGLRPSALVLEITESSVFSDPRRATETLTALDALGVKLSIDDFGTGYSSLTYLVQLPVSQIKIDRSFVAAMEADPQCAAVVHSTIELARNLSLETVAEGVESEKVMTTLAELGCDIAQGYFLSRPLPPAEATAWLLQAADMRLDLTA